MELLGEFGEVHLGFAAVAEEGDAAAGGGLAPGKTELDFELVVAAGGGVSKGG